MRSFAHLSFFLRKISMARLVRILAAGCVVLEAEFFVNYSRVLKATVDLNIVCGGFRTHILLHLSFRTHLVCLHNLLIFTIFVVHVSSRTINDTRLRNSIFILFHVLVNGSDCLEAFFALIVTFGLIHILNLVSTILR